jgi:hypothetical protein
MRKAFNRPGADYDAPGKIRVWPGFFFLCCDKNNFPQDFLGIKVRPLQGGVETPP